MATTKNHLDRVVADDAIDEHGTITLSLSRVSDYETCGARYELKHRRDDIVERVDDPEAAFGNAVHAALDDWHRRGELDGALGALEREWDRQAFAPLSAADPAEPGRWLDAAQETVRRYAADDRYPRERTLATEQTFDLEVEPGLRLRGSIDLLQITGDAFGVVDWKTGVNPPTGPQTYGNLQLTLYAWAAERLLGSEPAWVALDYVVPAAPITVAASQLDVDGALARVRKAAAGIRAEAFAPQPSGWACGRCPVRDACADAVGAPAAPPRAADKFALVTSQRR